MKNKLSIAAYLLSILLIQTAHGDSAADWTILTIMQADNNLAPFALQNIADIQRNIAGTKINKLIYWHRPRSQHRIRCKLKANGVVEEETVEIKTTPNMEQEVIDAMHWAVSKHPAKHYMLNLWDHGTGIIDHYGWAAKTNIITRHFGENSWLEVPGLSLIDDRGILYSDSTKTYMSNQQLSNACKHIKEHILKKNIDIIGMDACLMAMVEVAYQVKDYANLLVSSQNLEPGRGWDYGAFIKSACTSQETYTPLKLAQSIIDSYANYYNGKYSFYTLSAIDLSEISGLKKNIDATIGNILRCHTAEIQNILTLTKQAALTSVKFDSSEFIDLHCFYTNLLKSIKNWPQQTNKTPSIQRITTDQEKILSTLQESLENGLQLISKTVKANRVGASFSNAKGISIYFPQGNFHPSYARTMFATDTSWTYLVQAANIQRTSPNSHLQSRG